MTKLVDVKPDGSIFLRQEFFDYATGSRMVKDRAWEELFGFCRRGEDAPLEQRYCDMALAIQEVTEEIVIRLAGEARRLTGSERLCLAGGVALNCVANGKLQATGLFKDIFIQPAAGDAGGALGAAYAAHHIYFDQERTGDLPRPDALKGSCLGPEFGETDILPVARKFGLTGRKMDDLRSLADETAKLIAGGNVIGWFQGRAEFGPRALGCRSILADARNPEMQKKLNLSIKNREGFRPFAPAVLAEEVQHYFEMDGTSVDGAHGNGTPVDGASGNGASGGGMSPYMLLVKAVKKSRQLSLPEDYATRSWMEKLYFLRSDLPAITHVDYSARIQTVDRETHPRFWELLHSFRELTGCAVLINTSFNVRDEPIVNTPEDAFRCFSLTQMDYLVMGDFIFGKNPYIAGIKSRPDGFPEGPVAVSQSA
jgi:carbamoyltransferase